MSYCVKCGVELDASAKVCALCKTPVVMPRDLPEEDGHTPYPMQKAHLSKKEKRYTAQILSIILFALSAVCILVNRFYGPDIPWSVYPVGAFIIFYSFFVPTLIFKWHPFVFLSVDMTVIMVYLYMIAWANDGSGWFYTIALPTTFGIYILTLTILWIYQVKRPAIFIMNALVSAAAGILSLIIDGMVHLYVDHIFRLSWSLITASCFIALAFALWATYRNIRLRSEVQKRLHL